MVVATGGVAFVVAGVVVAETAGWKYSAKLMGKHSVVVLAGTAGWKYSAIVEVAQWLEVVAGTAGWRYSVAVAVVLVVGFEHPERTLAAQCLLSATVLDMKMAVIVSAAGCKYLPYGTRQRTQGLSGHQEHVDEHVVDRLAKGAHR